MNTDAKSWDRNDSSPIHPKRTSHPLSHLDSFLNFKLHNGTSDEPNPNDPGPI